jgi:hypothetical protein
MIRRIIGIDPGVHTGFAMTVRDTENLSWHLAEKGTEWNLETFSFWGAVKRLAAIQLEHPDQLPKVYIEDPNINKPTFHRKLGGESMRSYQARMHKISQNVGMNKRDAQLLIDWLSMRGWDYYPVPPRKAAKVNAEYFKKLTGYSKRSSQHARDAAMLILGRL